MSASPPERIDLTQPQPCRPREGAADEVIVCGRKGESPYRLRQRPAPRREALPAAQVQIADGVVAAAETEAADVGGQRSNRAMIRLKIKF